MGIMNEAKSGADLTHPHLSGGWLIGATVAVILLAFVAGVGLWLYGKGKAMVSNGKGTTSGVLAPISGIYT